jgi:hypothetical protein
MLIWLRNAYSHIVTPHSFLLRLVVVQGQKKCQLERKPPAKDGRCRRSRDGRSKDRALQILQILLKVMQRPILF